MSVNLYIVVHLGKKGVARITVYANDQKFINAAEHEQKAIRCTFNERRNALNKETNFKGVEQMACVLVVVLRQYCFLLEQSIKILSDSLAIIQF